MKLQTAVLATTLLLGLAHGSPPVVDRALAEIDPDALAAAVKCNQDRGTLTFLLLENEAVNAAVEDNIREDLAKIGFTVEAKMLSKDEINVARQSGDFHFSISETWGTPYDPHSYASGWIDGNGGAGVYPSMVNFDAPSSRDELLGLIQDVLQEEDPSALKTKWQVIHNYYHAQAVMMPFWGKRIPTLMNSRLTGYEAGFQQFDYPIHRILPLSGSTTMKIAPGARTGLFKTIGTMNAHVYGPNEFFSNNWIYEGLVAYGEGGQILPSLATSWTVDANDIGGDTYTFQLRQGVKFHDGMPWNCAAAKLNFDHLLAGDLGNAKHGWYGVGSYTADWSCTNHLEFVLRTNKKHGPYLQELTFIRPMRMISPGAFLNGNTTDPNTANSCHLDWGKINGTDVAEEVQCVGLSGIHGTGPYIYDSKGSKTVTDADGNPETVDDNVIFTANEEYWGGAPAMKRVEIIHYSTSREAKEALLNGDLDVVWGSGVLSDAQIAEIENDATLQETIRVFHSGDLQNVILLLNSGKPPFDDINVRKTVIHAINKAAIVEKELKGLQQVVDNAFPLEAPYCDVDLSPRWAYDLEKAVLLSCPEGSESSNNSTLALGLGLGLGIPFAIALVFAVMQFHKSNKLEDELNLVRKQEGVNA